MEQQIAMMSNENREMLLKQKRKNKTREFLFILLVTAFPMMNFIVFYLYKNASSIVLAFQEYDITHNLTWVGFQNFKVFFKDLFTPGNSYLIGLKNNVIAYLVSLLIFKPMQFALAFFIYKKATLGGTYRFVMMIPSIISSTVVALMFMRFINAIPLFMRTIGVNNFPKLLQDPRTRFGMTLFYDFWNGFGMTVIYYYNAMNRIDDEMIESAQLDGINYIKEFFFITFPMIFPTVTTFLITGFSSIIGGSGPLYLFWKLDAPTDVYRFGYILFRLTLKQGETAYPLVAAIGLVTTCVMFPLTLLLRNFLERIDPNNE